MANFQFYTGPGPGAAFLEGVTGGFKPFIPLIQQNRERAKAEQEKKDKFSRTVSSLKTVHDLSETQASAVANLSAAGIPPSAGQIQALVSDQFRQKAVAEAFKGDPEGLALYQALPRNQQDATLQNILVKGQTKKKRESDLKSYIEIKSKYGGDLTQASEAEQQKAIRLAADSGIPMGSERQWYYMMTGEMPASKAVGPKIGNVDADQFQEGMTMLSAMPSEVLFGGGEYGSQLAATISELTDVSIKNLKDLKGWKTPAGAVADAGESMRVDAMNTFSSFERGIVNLESEWENWRSNMAAYSEKSTRKATQKWFAENTDPTKASFNIKQDKLFAEAKRMRQQNVDFAKSIGQVQEVGEGYVTQYLRFRKSWIEQRVANGQSPNIDWVAEKAKLQKDMNLSDKNAELMVGFAKKQLDAYLNEVSVSGALK